MDGRAQNSVSAGKSVGLLAPKAPKRDIAGLDEPGHLLAPVSDADVFDTNERCLAREKVLQRLQADQDAVGGKAVMLADGLQQSFSDAWRLKARVAPVRVSSVVAHLFSDTSGSEWNEVAPVWWTPDLLSFGVHNGKAHPPYAPGPC
jgi:hypothetical protein